MNATPVKISMYGGPNDGQFVWLTKAVDRYFPSVFPDLLHHYHRVGDTLVYQGVVER